MQNRLIAIAVLTVAALAMSAHAQTPGVTIAENGKLLTPVYFVNPGDALAGNPLVDESLADVTKYLAQITGAEVVVQTVATVDASAGPGIYVGLASSLAALEAPDDLGAHHCVMRTDSKGRIVLAGGAAHGVSHAIYGLLHELGCRWYYPGAVWEIVPAQPTLRVTLDHRQSPDFSVVRRLWLGHGAHSAAIRTDFRAWQRRNRNADPFGAATAHSWIGLDREKDFAEHPEYFALVNGERRASKPCYSHPDVVQRATEHALSAFRSDPNRLMVSLSPPDGLNFCTCELCLKSAGVTKFHEAHGTAFGHQADGTLVSIASQTVFALVNEVARAVAEEFPGKQVGVLGYSGYAHPPTFNFEPNVFVEVTQGYRRTPLSTSEQLAAFGRKAKGLATYEYYDVEQWSWDQPGRARVTKLDTLQASLRYFHQIGITGMNAEMSNNFGPNGIGYYVAARLFWDMQLEARDIERELLEKSFGPAADAMRRVYRRWELGHGFEGVALRAMYDDLAEAAKLTEGLPAERARVDYIRMYAHFLFHYLPNAQKGHDKLVAALVAEHGEAEAKRRVEYLGVWVSRLIDTHMIHAWAFNRFFVQSGAALGIDTSTWQKPGPIPTRAEIQAAFQKDMVTFGKSAPAPVKVTLFGRELSAVQAPSASLADVPLQAGRFRSGRMYLPLKAGEQAAIEFDQPADGANVTFVDAASFSQYMDAYATTTVESAKVQENTLHFTAEAAGYYTVTWAQMAVQSVSHPFVLDGRQQKLGSGAFYFYVPKGTRAFILRTSAHMGPTVKVTTNKGRVVIDQQGGPKRPADAAEPVSEWTVEVPAGSDGGVWRFDGPGDVNTTASIALLGIPPFLSLSEAHLLTPTDALGE